MQRTDPQQIRRITQRMTVQDLTTIAPVLDGGVERPLPDHPAQTVSRTYGPRAGWSQTDIDLRRIAHNDMARQRATWAAWQRGYMTGVCMVLVTWIIWTAISYA